MRHIVELLRRFRTDEGGAFAVIFAVVAIVLIAMGGAAVDFTSLQQARTRSQVALDAAALALQPTIFNTGVTAGTIMPLAQKLLIDQLADGSTTWVDCASNGNKAPCVSVATPVIDTFNGQLSLTANLKVPMNFVSLVGVTTIPAQIVSVATRKKLGLEVALVLDNSGSMGTAFGTGTRLTTLKSSAICAATILYYGVTTCNNPATNLPWVTTALPSPSSSVKFALVPFNDEVNVGAANAIAGGWIDRTGGANTFDNDNFDSDDYAATPYVATPTDRVSLFTAIKDKNGNPLSWGGCVEARVNDGLTKQYDTDDTTPDSTIPATMFTPMFAPDNPDSGYSNSYISDAPAVCNWSGTCATTDTTVSTATPTTVVTKTDTTVSITKRNKSQILSGPTLTNSSTNTSASTTTSSSATSNDTVTATFGTRQTGANLCTCASGTTTTSASTGQTTTTSQVTGPTQISAVDSTYSGQNSTTRTYTTVTTTTTYTNPVTTTATRVASCPITNYAPVGLSDRVLQERLCKYTGSKMTKSVSLGFGPNADCPANPITPLTVTPATITTAINSMVSGGNTNVQEGAAWGFRVLSPTAPFTEGGPYNTSISKVMIVMTDGENTYSANTDMNGASLYAAYAFPYNNYDRDTYGAGASARGRMGDLTWSDANFEAQINARLAKTCTNAKAAGITVYTIGLATNATSDPAGNTTLLTNCATPTGSDLKPHYFFPTTATALQDAFVNIANQLSDLRISQ